MVLIYLARDTLGPEAVVADAVNDEHHLSDSLDRGLGNRSCGAVELVDVVIDVTGAHRDIGELGRVLRDCSSYHLRSDSPNIGLAIRATRSSSTRRGSRVEVQDLQMFAIGNLDIGEVLPRPKVCRIRRRHILVLGADEQDGMRQRPLAPGAQMALDLQELEATLDDERRPTLQLQDERRPAMAQLTPAVDQCQQDRCQKAHMGRRGRRNAPAASDSGQHHQPRYTPGPAPGPLRIQHPSILWAAGHAVEAKRQHRAGTERDDNQTIERLSLKALVDLAQLLFDNTLGIGRRPGAKTQARHQEISLWQHAPEQVQKPLRNTPTRTRKHRSPHRTRPAPDNQSQRALSCARPWHKNAPKIRRQQ
jgi:hypothetical protein